MVTGPADVAEDIGEGGQASDGQNSIVDPSMRVVKACRRAASAAIGVARSFGASRIYAGTAFAFL